MKSGKIYKIQVIKFSNRIITHLKWIFKKKMIPSRMLIDKQTTPNPRLAEPGTEVRDRIQSQGD